MASPSSSHNGEHVETNDRPPRFSDMWRDEAFAAVVRQSNEGMQTCRELSDFLRRRAQLEDDHARKLRALAERASGTTFAGLGFMMRPMAADDFHTLRSTLTAMRGEATMLADAHSAFASKVKEASSHMSSFVQREEPSRKKLVNDALALQKRYHDAVQNLQQTRTAYGEENKALAVCLQEADAAKVAQRPPFYVERLEVKVEQQRSKIAVACGRYKDAVLLANTTQHSYFNSLLPDSLEKFQKTEEKRLGVIAEHLASFSKLELAVAQAIQTSCIVLDNTYQGLDQDTDLRLFIARHHQLDDTARPQPFKFQEYGVDFMHSGVYSPNSDPREPREPADPWEPRGSPESDSLEREHEAVDPQTQSQSVDPPKRRSFLDRMLGRKTSPETTPSEPPAQDLDEHEHDHEHEHDAHDGDSDGQRRASANTSTPSSPAAHSTVPTVGVDESGGEADEVDEVDEVEEVEDEGDDNYDDERRRSGRDERQRHDEESDDGGHGDDGDDGDDGEESFVGQ